MYKEIDDAESSEFMHDNIAVKYAAVYDMKEKLVNGMIDDKYKRVVS